MRAAFWAEIAAFGHALGVPPENSIRRGDLHSTKDIWALADRNVAGWAWHWQRYCGERTESEVKRTEQPSERIGANAAGFR